MFVSKFLLTRKYATIHYHFTNAQTSITTYSKAQWH